MTTQVGLDLQPGAIPSADAATPLAGARRTTLRRVLRQRSAVAGLILIGFLCFMAIFADQIANYDPIQVLIGVEDGVKPRMGPCIHILGCPADQPEHWFGLDGNVRDEFSRIIHGSRISLAVGFVTVFGSIIIGMAIGAVSGFMGGRTDNGLMRVMDMILAFPALLLAIVVVTILGSNLTNAMIAVSIVSVPIYARVMRASVLSVREQDYVTAARALGDSSFNILRRRVLPNAITPLIVQGTLGIGAAVLEIAALSFLGLAAVAPEPEWGFMVGIERNQMFTSPLLVVIPGIMLTIFVLGFNLLGDGLRDAFDPRLTR
jgi:peptide/nickel transport system permease protein